MMEWVIFTWHSEKIMGRVGAVECYMLDEGGLICVDKHRDFVTETGLDIGGELLGYWDNKHEFKEWLEKMVVREVVWV